jgi:tetratricopeptide (TPR) repeat protein
MIKKYLNTLVVVGLAVSTLAIISWFAFPEWQKAPGGVFSLLGIVITAVLAVIKGLKDAHDFINPAAPKKETIQPIENTQVVNVIIGKEIDDSIKPEVKIHHNLPNTDYGQFCGREKELAQITSLLAVNSRHFLITIDGIGGIGKSAIALETAHHYLRDFENISISERFEAIIWVSAKQTILTAQGIQKRPQVSRTLEDIYVAIAITLQQPAITKANAIYQAELIRNILAKHRTLLVLDNLETVDDERVLTFLTELPAPTKAIVTTRHRIDTSYPIRVKGMDEKETAQLIRQECEKRNCELTDADSQRLYKYTGGVPLAIVWSVAQISSGYSAESVLRRLGNGHGDIARFCFEEVVQKIQPNKQAYQILMILSIFQTEASREAIGVIADLSEFDRDDGLVLLEKLSLINKHSDRFSMLPLTKDYSYSLLANDSEKLKNIRNRQRQYYLNKLETSPEERKIKDSFLSAERYRFRELETDNILELVDWCISVKDFEYIPSLIRGLSGYLWAVGYWNICYKYGQLALGFSRQDGIRDKELEPYFLFRLGRIDLMRGDYGVSERLLLNAMSLYSDHGNISKLAHVASYVGILYVNQKKYQDAEKVLLKVLEQARLAENAKSVARIQNVVGQVYLGQGKYDLAEKAITEAKEIREGWGPSTGLAASYELLGRLKLLQNEPVNALLYFNQCYEIAKKSKVAWYMAFAKKWSAEAFMKLGDFENAETCLNECLKIFQDTGMKDKLAESEQMLAEVKKNLKQP